jgi:holo-[acyl-carrier protein] synthase
MIFGIGTDIISVQRVAEMRDKHGAHFLDRVFTAAEQETAGTGPGAAQKLAARFAAKEAVMKALGTGWARGVTFLQIEVVREASGRPTIRLSGEAEAIARAMGATEVHLSLSHEKEHAVAFVVMEGREVGLTPPAPLSLRPPDLRSLSRRGGGGSTAPAEAEEGEGPP